MDVRDFPPLYTLQPVPRTRARQLELWRGLLVSSASAGGSGSSTSIDLSTWPGFSNESLSRSLEWEGRRAVGDAVVEAGWGEWEDAPAKTRLRVFSKPPEAWGALIYAWASDTARVGGAICTLYEIHSGDDAAATELAGLQPELCFKALKTLEKAGKVQLFPAQPLDETGVKFL